jgi:hypothetical protein
VVHARRTDAATRRASVRSGLDVRVRDEAWRVLVFVWTIIRSSIIPIDLCQVPAALDLFLDHLSRSNKHTRSRQIPRFLLQLETVAAPG